MCHFFLIFKGLSDYVFNNNFGEILAMAVLATIAFAAFLLEHDHLVTFYEGFLYLAYYFCALYEGCADLYGTIGVNEQHTVKFYRLSVLDFVAEVVYIQEAVLFCLELLTLNFYDNVHYNLLIINC